MNLRGPRDMRVASLTRHAKVTQCLGALGDESFYLVVHAPTDAPSLGGARAFEVPPRHFVKLHRGTWHHGPVFRKEEMTFVNLELSDTNVEDHTSVAIDEAAIIV